MKSASELFYTRRSRVGRPDPGTDSSIDRNTGMTWTAVKISVSPHTCATPPHKRASMQFDQGSSRFVSINGVNAESVSNSNRQSLHSNERLPGAVLLARAKLLERLRGVSVSANSSAINSWLTVVGGAIHFALQILSQSQHWCFLCCTVIVIYYRLQMAMEVRDSLEIAYTAEDFSKLYAGIAILWLHQSLNQPSVVYCFFFFNSYDTLFFIVDLHAITLPYDTQQLSTATRNTAAIYLACGVETSKASVFVQSHVRAHVELMWLLSSATPIGWLNRMIQFKEKSHKAVHF
ncbi:hypothetical protein J1N35_042561 [Gossypium stocksii]|uniref:Uncharacterized protein n=1 Tax=Gossypium stocksii TaxID=47602 RepID=A0A9D3U5S2_9ROSI|nr:hypothetical protein J1N35_042561 [Gossypium stocksii]